MTTPLEEKVALVTGANGGIGSAICRELASAGAHVVVAYRSKQSQAEALAASLSGSGHLVAPLEVTDSASVELLAVTCRERFGRLDILVNNAGISRSVPHDDLNELDDALIDEIFRVNWRGAFATIRAFRSLLELSGDALIVNISSIAGRSGFGSNIAYCASKAALDSLTRSLAHALAPRVRVVSVAPGWVEGAYAERMPVALLEGERARTPLGRIAQADDVAQAVLACAMGLRFSTGCIIPVDGGRIPH